MLVNLKRPLVQSQLHETVGDEASQLISTVSSESWEGEEFPLPRKDEPGILVSLHKLKELERIDIFDERKVTIGALVTAREIQKRVELRDIYMALSEGADSLGSPLVRARGTLGGNFCNARPAADMVIPSICLGAKLTLTSSKGERTVDSADFILAPGKTILANGEILTSILFSLPARSGSAYYKLAQRKALDISVVGVASAVTLTEDGNVERVRTTLGAVGPTPLIASSVEPILTGKHPTEDLLVKAAQAAGTDAVPIDDHRGSAEYRRHMVEVLTGRTLAQAIKRAGGEL
ncbi:nicotinate dehydrogenase FAD-subunit [bacterium BMS3Bbin04]|nr:nicotinate dehydrogenase FAD-subunit [bacterium BMS3Bbin04]